LNFTLNLKRDTTPDQVRKVLGAIASILTNSEKIQTGDVPVRFAGVGTYSLDIELEAYILTQDYNDFLRLRQDLLLRILDAVAAAGTALALPTQATVNYGGPAAGGSDSAPERDLALNGR
jgi:MscS family membrane protein